MEHTHSHAENPQAESSEEVIALLKYTAEHNRHHAEELHELSHGVGGEAEKLLHEAIQAVNLCTEKIEQAIHLLEAD